MTDYQIGDPVVDLAQGRAMVVLGVPDMTVDEWSDTNNYELAENYANAKLDTTADEGVVRCVYVSDIRSEPSKDYTFPESRVALIDAHHADDGQRIADRIISETLADVFHVLAMNGQGHRIEGLAGMLEGEGFDPDVVSVARELADVEQRIGAGVDD